MSTQEQNTPRPHRSKILEKLLSDITPEQQAKIDAEMLAMSEQNTPMTAAEFLVQKRILRSADLTTRWNLNLSRDANIQSVKDIINAMDEYAAAYHDKKVKEIEDQTEPYKGHIRV